MLSFLIYADDTTISSTLNMFSYNIPIIHEKKIDSLINEELLRKMNAQNQQSITKCGKI